MLRFPRTANGRALSVCPPMWSAIIATVLMNSLAVASTDGPGHRVAGVVWISPSCAGAQREQDPCRAPLAGVEVRLSGDSGQGAVTTKTDAAGAFAMRAPAGHYRLYVVGAGKIPRCPELDITLPMVKSAPLELECDSGMR